MIVFLLFRAVEEREKTGILLCSSFFEKRTALMAVSHRRFWKQRMGEWMRSLRVGRAIGVFIHTHKPKPHDFSRFHAWDPNLFCILASMLIT
jgi:hypothetical protein